jgi:hypothetical protein
MTWWEELIEKYPILLRDEMGCPPYLEVSEGWRGILEELLPKLEEGRLLLPKDRQNCHIVQLKEKFGGLRVYLSDGNDPMDLAILEAEKKAIKTCEFCGEPGTLRNRGWWKVRCHTCQTQYEQEMKGFCHD